MTNSIMLSVKNINKYFGNNHVVKDLSFQVQKGGLVSLLGPSGCGKTTTLRMIAGLEEASSGVISLAGNDITFVPPYKRKTGFVFQNYALFPHMNVEQNLSFGLEMQKVPKQEIPERVQNALKLIALEGYEKRLPRELSGGQQQRVALARALILEPVILLLDEPLSNLDARLRDEMRIEIKRIQQSLDITTIFVTHDQEEALTLSDRIIVMSEGRLLEEGTPIDIYTDPKCKFTASFIGNSNIINGKIADIRDNNFIIHTDEGLVFYASIKPELKTGDLVTVFLRHERIFAFENKEKCDKSNIPIAAEIRLITFLGPTIEYICEANGVELRARISNPGNHEINISTGQQIYLNWDPRDCILLKHNN